jgi:methionyl-tRNA formyltransferase
MARIIFLGTPEFAVPSLDALAEHAGFDLVGVVTQPDRPAGRGRSMRQSPVKERAAMLGLPVFQPETLRAQEAVDHLAAWRPDVLVVAAFGQILRTPVLELAPSGCINVHASLLPRWRGAAPIQYAIRAGDNETGVTIMKVDEGLDTGPMLARRTIPIAPDETGASLHEKLAALGAELLPPTLAGYLAGEIVPQPQPEEGVTLAPSLKKSAGEIDWTQSAVEVDRQVRAYTPWPGTFTDFEGSLLKIVAGAPLPSQRGNAPPGTLLVEGGALTVQTGDGLYRLDTVQPAGKQQMSSEAFLAGRPDAPGVRLGS